MHSNTNGLSRSGCATPRLFARAGNSLQNLEGFSEQENPKKIPASFFQQKEGTRNIDRVGSNEQWWIHCNICYSTNNVQFFTSCGHFLCSKHSISPNSFQQICPACNSRTQAVALQNIPEELQGYFGSPLQTLKSCASQLSFLQSEISRVSQILSFQSSHQISLIQHIKSGNSNNQEMEDKLRSTTAYIQDLEKKCLLLQRENQRLTQEMDYPAKGFQPPPSPRVLSSSSISTSPRIHSLKPSSIIQEITNEKISELISQRPQTPFGRKRQQTSIEKIACINASTIPSFSSKSMDTVAPIPCSSVLPNTQTLKSHQLPPSSPSLNQSSYKCLPPPSPTLDRFRLLRKHAAEE